MALSGLFLAAFLAATPVPFQSEIVFLGMQAAGWDTGVLVLVASVGNTLGSCVTYALGRWLADQRNHRWFPLTPPQLARAEGWFARWGVWLLLLSWAPFGDAIVAISGVPLRIGDEIGASRGRAIAAFPPPVLQSLVEPVDPAQRGLLWAGLRDLADEDPLIDLRLDDNTGQAAVSLHGEVQKEIIAALLGQRYGVSARFTHTTVVCLERVRGVGEDVLRILTRVGGYLDDTRIAGEYLHLSGLLATARLPELTSGLPDVAEGEAAVVHRLEHHAPVAGSPPQRCRIGPDPADREAWFRDMPS